MRRSNQTALHRLHLALTKLLAPILSFTCEEVWKYSSLGPDAHASVHMDLFPAAEELTDGISAVQRAAAADYDRLVPVRDQVLKSLDSAREEKVIGSSLEAAVTMQASGEIYELLQKFGAELPGLFIVSAVALKQGTGDLTVTIERASGDKCERCWKYTRDVGSDDRFPTACASCAKTLREYF